MDCSDVPLKQIVVSNNGDKLEPVSLRPLEFFMWAEHIFKASFMKEGFWWGAFNGKHVYAHMPQTLQHSEKLSTAPTVQEKGGVFHTLFIHSPSDLSGLVQLQPSD